jgi:hypothetical protein
MPSKQQDPLSRSLNSTPAGSSLGEGAPSAVGAGTEIQSIAQIRHPLGTIAEALSKKTKAEHKHVPEGFPVGPHSSLDILTFALRHWSTDLSLPDTGFTIELYGERRYHYKHSFFSMGKKYVCSECKAAEKSRSQMWTCEFEETMEGWYLRTPPVTAHKHELIRETAILRANRNSLFIPQDLVALGVKMAKCNIKTPDIKRFFDEEAEARDIPITWDYKKVYNACSELHKQNALDASGLLDFLQERRDTGYQCFVRADGEGCLDRIFFELEDALTDYAVGGADNVLLFDPTHGTNKYGLKLALFVTVAATGASVALAVCVFAHEDEETFEWCFRCAACTFRRPPAVLFTDSAPALESALNNMRSPSPSNAFQHVLWPNTVHLLCVFHLWQNFYKHIKPMFGSKTSEWHTLSNMFWRVAKDSDVADQETFDPRFLALRSFIEQHCNRSETYEKGVKWLDSLYKRRHKWAACFVQTYFTYGMHSTQRAEAMQHSTKRALADTRNLLKALAEKLIKANKNRRMDVEANDIRKRMKALHSDSMHPILAPLATILTGWALDVLRAQAAQAQHYLVIPIQRSASFKVQRIAPAAQQKLIFDNVGNISSFVNDDDFGVNADESSSRITTATKCSCQFPICWGLPCRHIFAVMVRQQMQTQQVVSIPRSLIKEVWFAASDERRLKLRQELIVRHQLKPLQASPASSSRMTKADRIALITAEMRPLIDLAGETDKLFATITTVINGLRSHIQSNGSTPLVELATGTADEKAFKLGVGLLHKAASAPPHAEWLEFNNPSNQYLVGSYILYKWGAKNRGGWFIGDVRKQLQDESNRVAPRAGLPAEPCNFEVYYENDGTTVAHALTLSTYTTNPTAKEGSWMLLDNRELSDSPAQIGNPAGAAPRGAQKRKKQAHGPGSGGPRK